MIIYVQTIPATRRCLAAAAWIIILLEATQATAREGAPFWQCPGCTRRSSVFNGPERRTSASQPAGWPARPCLERESGAKPRNHIIAQFSAGKKTEHPRRRRAGCRMLLFVGLKLVHVWCPPPAGQVRCHPAAAAAAASMWSDLQATGGGVVLLESILATGDAVALVSQTRPQN